MSTPNMLGQVLKNLSAKTPDVSSPDLASLYRQFASGATPQTTAQKTAANDLKNATDISSAALANVNNTAILSADSLNKKNALFAGLVALVAFLAFGVWYLKKGKKT